MNDTIVPPPPELPVDTGSTFKMFGPPDAIAALFLAIGKARDAMDPVLADTTGQFKDRKFKYADLSSMYKALIPALTAQGVTAVHPNCQVDPETQRAMTLVAGHGAIVMTSHDFTWVIKDENIKGLGSTLTYLNRYQLRGLMAIAGDDDPDADGQAGTAPFKSQPKPAAPPPGNGRTRAKDPEPTPINPTGEEGKGDQPLALDDHDVDPKAPLVMGSPTSLRLTDLMKTKGLTEPRAKRDAFILEVTGQDVSQTGRGKLNYGDARKLIAKLEQMP